MLHGRINSQPSMQLNEAEQRLADLSEEFLDADASRREEIGREFQAVLERKIVPFPRKG